MEWSWGRGLAHTDSTRFNKKIICANLWLKKPPNPPNPCSPQTINLGKMGVVGENYTLFIIVIRENMTNFVSCKVDKCRKCVFAPVF